MSHYEDEFENFNWIETVKVLRKEVKCKVSETKFRNRLHRLQSQYKVHFETGAEIQWYCELKSCEGRENHWIKLQ